MTLINGEEEIFDTVIYNHIIPLYIYICHDVIYRRNGYFTDYFFNEY